MTVRGNTLEDLGERRHWVDWLGLWVEEEEGEEDVEELEQRDGGGLESLE